jgi:predicted acylesterase/phospholipase RssA
MELSEEEIVSSNRWVWLEKRPQKDYTLPVFSVLGGRRANDCLVEVFGDTEIEDLWTNYFCVTSSLTNAELLVHRSGLLRELLQACLALPGISPPVLRGEDLLVDGGVINNVPGDVMQELCGESVIVIDVNVRMDVTMHADKVPSPWQFLASRFLPGRKRLVMPGLLEIVARSEALNSIIKANQIRQRIPLYLEPPIKNFGLFDFNAMDSIAEVGYEYTKTTIAEWRANGLLDGVAQTGTPAPLRPDSALLDDSISD